MKKLVEHLNYLEMVELLAAISGEIDNLKGEEASRISREILMQALKLKSLVLSIKDVERKYMKKR